MSIFITLLIIQLLHDEISADTDSFAEKRYNFLNYLILFIGIVIFACFLLLIYVYKIECIY